MRDLLTTIGRRLTCHVRNLFVLRPSLRGRACSLYWDRFAEFPSPDQFFRWFWYNETLVLREPKLLGQIALERGFTELLSEAPDLLAVFVKSVSHEFASIVLFQHLQYADAILDHAMREIPDEPAQLGGTEIRRWLALVHIAFLKTLGAEPSLCKPDELRETAARLVAFAESLGRIAQHPKENKPNLATILPEAHELASSLIHTVLIPIDAAIAQSGIALQETNDLIAAFEQCSKLQLVARRCLRELTPWLNVQSAVRMLEELVQPVSMRLNIECEGLETQVQAACVAAPRRDLALLKEAKFLSTLLEPPRPPRCEVNGTRVFARGAYVDDVSPLFAKLLQKLLDSPEGKLRDSQLIHRGPDALYREAFTGKPKQWNKLRAIVRGQNMEKLVYLVSQ